MSSMKFYLLTHQRELDRKTNTGQLVLKTLGNMAERIVWDRVNPEIRIVKHINDHSVSLMYPKEEAENAAQANFENVLIIDSSWQEANKIYNKSAYLKSAHKIKLSDSKPSAYTLRRNQKQGGLCTAECVIALLKLRNETQKADALQEAFTLFNC